MRIEKNEEQLHNEINSLLKTRVIIIHKDIDNNKYRIMAKEEFYEPENCYLHSFFIQRKIFGCYWLTIYNQRINKEIFDNEQKIYELFCRCILDTPLKLTDYINLSYERFYEFELKKKKYRIGYNEENVYFIRKFSTFSFETIFYSNERNEKITYENLEDFIYDFYIFNPDNLYIEI